jgi:DNA-binding IclR family transcriptional regulator
VIGSQLEAYCSGLGKILLAALPADHLENFLLEGDLIALTPNTITSVAILRRQLEMVRRTRFAIDNRESRTDMSCVAVPVCDNAGRTVAAMSATEFADRLTPERQVQIRDALFEAAAAVGRRMFPSVQPFPALAAPMTARQGVSLLQ